MTTTALSIFVLVLLAKSENVKFYLADCLEQLSLDNYHTYAGEVVTPPPMNITVGSVAAFEYEYSSRSAFGSYLDGNLNYYAPGASAENLLHYYWNVNETGIVYADIEYSGVVGSTICTDIKQGTGSLPQVIGAYVYWKSNSTFDKCKSITNSIPSCTFIA